MQQNKTETKRFKFLYVFTLYYLYPSHAHTKLCFASKIKPLNNPQIIINLIFSTVNRTAAVTNL
jgi:hypothetical protein